MFFDVYVSLCASKGMSPNGVAKQLGFPSSSVTQWKHGSTPRPVALQKIADYFGVSVHFLLGAEQQKKPTLNEDELTPLQLEAINLALSLSDDDLQRLIRITKAVAGE